ncbi:MAG: isoprenylcysteine carboxyl methyltransferase family protein [Spirochaetaceae bacterium]|nr:isoprenylcysteine carboxyl methyltransferase family protein [Spirochaetaceae bacterium]
MTSVALYAALVGAVGLERLAELVVSARNIRAAKAEGAVERGFGHYPVMVALHMGLLVGALVEVLVADRPFQHWLGWPMLVLVVGAQALRWWCISTLGHQWNTRIVVLPGAGLVSVGPYRWLRHPNYLAVVVEGVALPLVHGAWVTALVFTVANAALLRTRIRCEEKALRDLVPGMSPRMSSRMSP